MSFTKWTTMAIREEYKALLEREGNELGVSRGKVLEKIICKHYGIEPVMHQADPTSAYAVKKMMNKASPEQVAEAVRILAGGK